jgi:hypothetical protein
LSVGWPDHAKMNSAARAPSTSRALPIGRVGVANHHQWLTDFHSIFMLPSVHASIA